MRPIEVLLLRTLILVHKFKHQNISKESEYIFNVLSLYSDSFEIYLIRISSKKENSGSFWIDSANFVANEF